MLKAWFKHNFKKKREILLGAVVVVMLVNPYTVSYATGSFQNTAGVATVLERSMPEPEEALDEDETNEIIGIAGVEEILSIQDPDISQWNNYIAANIPGEAVAEANVAAAAPVAELTYWGYHNVGIANVTENLNVRQTPDANGTVVGQMTPGSGCEILGVEGDYTYISSGKVTGYVASEYLLTGAEAVEAGAQVQKLSATVTAQNLKVRAEASTSSKVLGMVKSKTVWEVLEQLEGWVKIFYDNTECYVSADYVTVGYALDTAMTMTEVKYGRGVTDVGISIAEYALQFVGNPYVYGGTSLTNGADCSGFTLTIFKKYGVTLPHSARSQATYGTSVAIADLRPGDLVFYSRSNGINHVTIYIGDGQVVHASTPESGIKISNLYYRTPTCARRLISD